MKWKTILGILIISLFIVSCGNQKPVVDDTGATTDGVSTVVNGNNKFAFDLYDYYKDDEENIFFSPYSISTALAMTYEGANGKTADEMKSVFYFPDENIMRPSFAKIYNDINKGSKPYKLSTANALWAQENYQFLEEYFNTVEQYYGGKVTNLDFGGETEKSRVTINTWVEDQTNDKIKDLIPEGVIDSSTRLVLTNAIYFKGNWVKEFDKKKTYETDFHKDEETTVKVDMMSMSEEDFNYGENEDLQILELPYKGEELSMLILLPKENLDSIELNVDNLDEWKAMMNEQEVNIYIPKFTFETKYFMVKTLSDLGMPTAFGGEADFSGMTGSLDLYISNVIHQAFVEVNEEGTEAAAATAVIMAEMAVRPMNIFRADHPFIFIIQEKDTGNILFMGKVTDPS